MRPCIYALTDPNGEVRYIGQAKNFRVRLTGHLCPHGRRGHTYRAAWLRALHESGQKPGWFIVAYPDDLDAAELYWIAKLRKAGARLVNTADGGTSLGHARRAKANSRWAGKCTPIQRMMRAVTMDAKDARKRGDEARAIDVERRGQEFQAKLAKAMRDRGPHVRGYVNAMLAEQYAGMA